MNDDEESSRPTDTTGAASRRQRLIGSIDNVLGDILYLKEQIAKIEGRQTSPQSPKSPSRRGRPKTLKTLIADFEKFTAERAWLHRKWLHLRGEPPFAPGSAFEGLAALGIVAPPSEPVSVRRGRPSQSIIGEALCFWVNLLRAQYAAQYGKQMTIKAALILAQSIIRKRYKKTFVARPSDYNRAMRNRASRR
jgi:hypothetical protein